MRKISFFLATLCLLANPVLAQEDTFPDVPEDHIFKQAIEDSKGGIIRGYGDGTFHPDQRVTRRELFVMIARDQFTEEEMKKCDLSKVPFPDFDKNDWGNKEICMGYKAGYISGDDVTKTLRPADPVTVVEMVKVLSEARDIKPDTSGTNGEWFAGYVKANEAALPLTFSSFNKEVTRAEMTEVLWRSAKKPSDVLHTTYKELAQPLGTVESCQELAGLMKDAWKQQNYLNGYPVTLGIDKEGMMEAMPVANAPSMDLGEGGGGVSFSETNVQVEGVDEADLVKTDGVNIYTVQDGVVKIIQAEPANAMKELAHLKFNDFYPQEMYLHESGDKKWLVLAGGTKSNNVLISSDLANTRIWPGFGGETHVKVLDITTATAPKTLYSFTVEGYLSGSRLLVDEGRVYFVTNDSFDFWNLEKEELENLKGEELLPLVKVGSAEAKPAMDCAGISYVKGFIRPQSVTVTSVDLKDGSLKNQMILGVGAETIYMSLNNLYLTQQSQDHILYTDFVPEKDKSSTTLFKLPLSLNKPALAAQVPGWPLNQFSLSEYNNHLRIATTENDLWWRGDERSNGVYILDEEMKLTGKIEGLAPTETIYSARFMGDRGYLVTFRQVDPLFALDLSDPKAPKVSGELKIPGFSNYLHPFGDHFLIGIGQDADEDTGATQGLKVSLFNVSDPKNLKEVDSIVLGDGGYSEAFYNHKAVLFTEDKLAKGEALLAFPVETWGQVEDSPECNDMSVQACDPNKCQVVPGKPVCSNIEGGGQICSSQESVCQSKTFHQENFNGAAVFGVKETGLELKGQITHHVKNPDLDYDYTDWLEQVYRALWIGNDLFTLSRGNVWANDLMDLEVVKGKLKLSEYLQ